MEIQIKRAVKAGNSSAVILPKSWLNEEVRVELVKKTPEIILASTLSILSKYMEIKEIIGIYLVGSYARSEEDGTSDIDILVITKNTDKQISEGIYNILALSSSLLKQKLEKDLFPIGPMIKEAKPLLNSVYLDSLDIRITKRNVKWYLDTTKEKIDLIEKIIRKIKEKDRKYASNPIAYTLVLRIRTLNIIKNLILDKDYSKMRFIERINKISGNENAYKAYLAVKNNLREENNISLEEIEGLHKYLKSELKEVNKLISSYSK